MALKTYEVTGTKPVFGYQPGERAQLDLPPDKEARHINAGHLQEVPAKGSELLDLSRAELDELAVEVGIPEPDRLPNKAAVAEAIAGKE